MCGRYYIEPDEDDLRFQAAMEQLNRKALMEGVKTAGEIFPTDTVPVIAPDRKREISAFAMTWGYNLNGRRVINARSEGAAQSPLFRDGFLHRRCIVPASYYFEWRRDGKRSVKYAIRPEHGKLYMAGVYRLEGIVPVFAILTRPASHSVMPVHDRMPVILTGGAADEWLDEKCDPARLVAGAQDDMTCRAVEDEQVAFPLGF